MLKLAYRMMKRQYGKVISPMKVIYSRKPPFMFFTKKIYDIEKNLSLSKSEKLLIRSFVAHVNNCSFCSDLSAYEAAKNNVEDQKIIELLHYQQSDSFTKREKALLAYIDEITTTKNASDETFDRLKHYYSETEIIEITWICATENYLNLMTKPLGVRSDDLGIS